MKFSVMLDVLTVRVEVDLILTGHTTTQRRANYTTSFCVCKAYPDLWGLQPVIYPTDDGEGEKVGH
jgi:hypothetical protein